MRFATIAGLPRSGSTLLCNLLAQRPDVHVSSTSALPAVVSQVSTLLTNSPEVTSDLLNVPGARERNIVAMRAFIEAWYPDTDDKLVIDKSRGWGYAFLLLQRLFPDVRIIATIRDPREVFASVERAHRASAEFGPHNPLTETARQMLSPQGLIGGPITWTEDLVRRRPCTESGEAALMVLSYDSLGAAPEMMMRNVDHHLGLEPFDYDFESVQSTATDEDVLYRFKYPHDGSGPVKPRPSGWQDVISDDIASQIRDRWPFFFQTFGYWT